MMILITNTIFYWYWSMIFCFYISTHVTQHAYILQPIIIIFMIIAHDDDEKVVTLRQTDRKDWVKQKKSIDLSIDQHKHMSTWTHTHTGVNKMNEKINYINNRRSKNDEKNFTSFLNIIGEYITIKKKLKKTWRTNTQQTLTCWLKQEKQYQQVFQKKKMELMISTAKQQTNQSRLVWTIPDNHFLRIDLSIWTIWSRESWCVCVIYIPTISSWQPQRIVCKKNEH